MGRHGGEVRRNPRLSVGRRAGTQSLRPQAGGNPPARRLHSNSTGGWQGREAHPVAARVNTVAFLGFQVLDVDVQVHISTGLPAFTKVETH